MTVTFTESDGEFLARPRLGTLTTVASDGEPQPVPVWFDWDRTRFRMFSSASAQKVRNVLRRPQASLLIANEVGEREQWLRASGDIAVVGSGVAELAERLARRYWDLDRADAQRTLDTWRAQANEMVVLELSVIALQRYGHSGRSTS